MAKIVKQRFNGDKCPICSKAFRSEACPHSWVECDLKTEESWIRAIVRDEMGKKYGPIG